MRAAPDELEADYTQLLDRWISGVLHRTTADASPRDPGALLAATARRSAAAGGTRGGPPVRPYFVVSGLESAGPDDALALAVARRITSGIAARRDAEDPVRWQSVWWRVPVPEKPTEEALDLA